MIALQAVICAKLHDVGMAATQGVVPVNAPLPASAAVERFFSTVGLVMSHKCTRLSDKNFKNLDFFQSKPVA